MVDAYLAALEQRHLVNLTRPELTRALRALSSLYVERRDKIGGGAALDGAGKRAAFALFYGPLHFLTISAIVRALTPARSLTTIHDIGCGTGVGGAAWALAAAGKPSVSGIDRHRWAVAEANWTYAQFGLRGSARVGDALRDMPRPAANEGVILAYTVNELDDEARAALLDKAAIALERGSAFLVVEPIARRDRGWWTTWMARLAPLGAIEREWRLPAILPPLLRQIAKSAGLDPRELTARTLSRL